MYAFHRPAHHRVHGAIIGQIRLCRFSGLRLARHHQAGEERPDLEVLESIVNLETRQLTYETTLALLRKHPDLRGIYCAGGGMEGAIAALREVEEETGLQHITLGPLLIKTFHTYPLKGKQVFKETHWYAMTAPEQKLSAQAEEDITQALWITPAELPQILADTYGNIKLVIEAGEDFNTLNL